MDLETKLDKIISLLHGIFTGVWFGIGVLLVK